ncbi:hypothetical protein [Antribacter gilvus]|uniref:hypothetical protein n=1 Tax=Antribacter gilvus TaxID=2304675 RepID=UPI000F7B5D08|nr:hypothetical protein [Antribacter gilvus]
MIGNLWKLPGPKGYIADIAANVARGRHVVAVLPEYLCAENVTAELADELVEVMDDAAHLGVGADRSLVDQACADISDDFDVHPVSVRELLAWGNPRARTFVLDASDLSGRRRPELQQFLERLAHDSRVTADGSIRLVIIAQARDLPPALNPDGDVTVVTRWFWNRVARWDTVAHVALVEGGLDVDTLADEIRVETIVELARWDLPYATNVAERWARDGALPSGSGRRAELCAAASIDGVTPAKVGAWPPPRLVDAWNVGAIDGWRGRVCIAPTAEDDADRTMERHVWAAQARVLLPFIETKRIRLEMHLREELGAARFDREVASGMPVYRDPNYIQASVPEIALLREIARVARRDERRATSLDLLRDARNRLSHLVPLTHDEVVAIERACLWLG